MHLAERVQAQYFRNPSVKWSDFLVAIERIWARNSRRQQIEAIESELPDFLYLFSIAMKNGLSALATFTYLTERSRGEIADEFREISSNLDLGSDLSEELSSLSSKFPSQNIETFVQTLVSNLNTGASIANSLMNQAVSIRDSNDRKSMKQAAKNETKMLVPTIFLILPVTILFAIFPSLAMLTNSL